MTKQKQNNWEELQQYAVDLIDNFFPKDNQDDPTRQSTTHRSEAIAFNGLIQARFYSLLKERECYKCEDPASWCANCVNIALIENDKDTKQKIFSMVEEMIKSQTEEETPIGKKAFFKRIGGIEEIKGYNQALSDIKKEIEKL